MTRFPAFFCISLAAQAMAAAAEEGPGVGPTTRVLFPQGGEYCYAATFDDAYRKSHPGQKLSAFMLYRVYRVDPSKEAVDPPVEEQIALDKGPEGANWTAVAARFTDAPHLYDQSVSCYDAEGMQASHCAVDCDGGSFDANPEGDGVRVSFNPDYGGLSLNQSCGDPDETGKSRWLTGAEAGGAFSLPRRPIADCAALDSEMRPDFAKDPVSLRERIETNGWRCLRRVYDAAHLKKHPHQQVAAIAVTLKGPATVTREESGWSSTELALTLSLKLRNGERANKDIACLADDYQFRCGGEFRLRRRDDASAMMLAGEYGGEDTPEQPAINGLKLGTDDLMFRLEASTAADCAAE